MKTISVEGETFVKASEIARELGYTADYVGQLCRGKKIRAELVGRTWYVHEADLRRHKRTRYRTSKAKTRAAVQEVLKEQKAGAKSATPAPRLNDHYFYRYAQNHYEADTAALLPLTPSKGSTSSAPPDSSAETRPQATESTPATTNVEPDSRESIRLARVRTKADVPAVPKDNKPRKKVLSVKRDLVQMKAKKLNPASLSRPTSNRRSQQPAAGKKPGVLPRHEPVLVPIQHYQALNHEKPLALVSAWYVILISLTVTLSTWLAFAEQTLIVQVVMERGG